MSLDRTFQEKQVTRFVIERPKKAARAVQTKEEKSSLKRWISYMYQRWRGSFGHGACGLLPLEEEVGQQQGGPLRGHLGGDFGRRRAARGRHQLLRHLERGAVGEGRVTARLRLDHVRVALLLGRLPLPLLEHGTDFVLEHTQNVTINFFEV